MELIYISPLRYPSEKTGSQFSMKSCESFAKLGLTVELWAPQRRNPMAPEDPFSFHGVSRNFKIVFLPALDLAPFRFFYIPLALSFAIAVFLRALLRGPEKAIYYSHEEFALFLLTFLRCRTVYEIHDFPGNKFFSSGLMRRVKKAVVTNNWKKEEAVKRFSFPAERILVMPNAVDLKEFYILLGQREARLKIGLPLESKIILYTGHLYSWKGTDTLLEAGQFLSGKEIIYFVGGTDKDIEKFRDKSLKLGVENVEIVGRRPHEEIPIWLRAADVLILPNTAKEDISKYYTSPVKLFEYLASGRPLVASNLPSLREIVDEKMVTFFEPDNARNLAEKIKWVLKDPAKAEAKAVAARLEAEKCTWDKRARGIIEFIKK